MSYTLIAIFMLSGDFYVERTGLTLQGCAGHAAMIRQEMLAVLPKLNKRIGEVQYRCVPERTLVRRATDQHGIGLDE